MHAKNLVGMSPPAASTLSALARTVFYYITYMYGIAFRPKKGGVQANLIMDFEAKVGGVYAKKFRGAPRRKGGCTQFDKESGRAWDEFEDRMTVTEAPQTPAGGARQFFFRARARARARAQAIRYAAPRQASACTVCAWLSPQLGRAHARASISARDISVAASCAARRRMCANPPRGRQGPRRGLRG